ncbi:rod shape-determining protein [Anaerosacchariphilus polymeriproducens]|uniref:Cell shape-determining protein MreB n=1 Tax=Anaerosacchariphilus polymeriproducens TaxID=1812858 RepID=A0A371AU27_9FIRM|nr:rod shape-determining protein [Anaerosacchariphilus polymeriproducens]RDU23065.1 rod shape-determining protein [Anaerosacchariphilus polymeriproducens]
MINNIFGVDLGTSNIKLYNKATDKIINEKNVIAIENKRNVYGFGDEAYDMFEKAPEAIDVSFPMFNGVVADYKNMQMLLNKFIEKSSNGKNCRGAEFVIAVPTDITEVEKKTFLDVAKGTKSKPKNVLIVEKPIAAAVGLGLNVKDAKGIMVVDIGADTTEISVLSLGGIVLSKLLQLGGNKLDLAIASAIKKKYNLIIGNKTARMLKQSLGTVIESENITMKAVGRDIVTGLPVQMEIESHLIYQSMTEHIKQLMDAVKIILEKTPPELSSDIIENGIYLTGGASQLKDLNQLMKTITGLEVNTGPQPSESVVRGLMKIATDKELNELAYFMKYKSYK